MHLCHARHYSQEDMCIIGEEKEEVDKIQCCIGRTDSQLKATNVLSHADF